MATILKQPEVLSLSGNINKFELYSTTKVRFVLKQGTNTLLDEDYVPGTSGHVEIDIKEILNNHLRADLPGDNLVFQQSNLVKEFTAEIDGVPVSFRVIRSGVDNLADTPANFLKGNFLTWQPQTKKATYYQPESLTYYAYVHSDIKLKAYFEDNTTHILTLVSMVAGNAYTVDTQYSRVAGLLGNKNPMYYDVWVEQSGNRLSYIQRYISSHPDSDQEEWFLFQNSLGGIDTAKMSGVTDFANELEHKIALFGETQDEYFVDSKRQYKKNTGVLDEYSRKWILDFFVSVRKWKVSVNGVVRAIVVHSSDVNYTTLEPVNDYSFTYSFSEDKPFLNLTRDPGALPDNLVFPTLSDLFFLPPRLNEFPRITLSDETLIPLQSPFNEIWGVTTWGHIHDTVISTSIDTVLSAIPGMTNEIEGGLKDLIDKLFKDGFTDISSLIKFQIDPEGYLKYDGKDIRVNWADYAGHALIADFATSFMLPDGTVFDGTNYLRSDIDDIAKGQITFEKGLISLDMVRSGLFQEGFAEGFGWSIGTTGKSWLQDLNLRGDLWGFGRIGTPVFASGFTGWGLEMDMNQASLELDYLTVRKSMRVYELVVNQLRGSNGSIVVSDFNKIKEVVDNGSTWKCIIDDYDGEMYVNMRPGDIIRCQVFDGNNIKYYLAQVTSVGNDFFEISKTMLEGSDVPAEGDVVCRWNNYTDTDRQGLIYLTSSDSHSPFIDILDGPPNLTEFERLRARIGRLTGVHDPLFPNMRSYGIYTDSFYGKGELILHSSGKSISSMFSVLEDRITAEIKEVRTLIPSEGDNVLRNATFSTDTSYWDYVNEDIRIYTAAGNLLFINNRLFLQKNNVTEIIRDPQVDRSVLKIINNTVTQNQAKYNTHSDESLKYELVFTYKVTKPGRFFIGISDTEMYYEVENHGLSEWKTHAVAGTWDGVGDFKIGISGGQLLICNVSLRYNDKSYILDMLESFKVEYKSGMEILSNQLKLYSNAQYTDLYGRLTNEYKAAITVSAQNINLSITALENNLSSFRSETQTSINLLNGEIALKVSNTKFSELGNRVSLAESTITQLAGKIDLKVSYTDFTTLQGRVSLTESNITLLSNSITTKVSETVFDQFKNQVTSNYATTVWTSSLISNYVHRDTYNGATVASLINQSADGVKIYANKLEISTGAGNLIKDSEFLKSPAPALVNTTRMSDTPLTNPLGITKNIATYSISGTPSMYVHLRFQNVLPGNGTYTFSAYIRVNKPCRILMDVGDNDTVTTALEALSLR